MYNNQDKYWFNQTLMYHHDKTEGTDAKLTLTATASSNDLIVLGQIFLSIRISNHLSKSCLLKFQDVLDLIKSVDELFKTDPSEIFKNENKNTILKKYNKVNNLILDFKTNTNNIPVVKISLRSSDTDFTSIILHFNVFASVVNLFKNYKDQYPNYITMLNQQMICKKLATLDMINNSIKGLYSNLESKPIEVEEAEIIDKENVSWSSDMSEEFDKFVEDTEIQLPELEKDIEKAEIDVKTEPVVKVESKLFDILENKLDKFEVYIKNRTNILEFKNELQSELGFELLPSGDEDEIKSLVYLTTYYYQLILESHTLKGEPIPSSFPLMKYRPKSFDNNNLDLAYDLLMIQAYFKVLRGRLESKITDSNKNYSMFHLALRMFTDSLIYGFIQEFSPDKVLSIIMNRYKYFRSLGAFEKYEKMLDENICPPIETKDMSLFLNELIPVAQKFAFIKQLHDENKDSLSLKLGVKNPFNLEQIIKEVIPLEINEKIGQENDFTDIRPEIKALFKSEKPVNEKRKSEKMNPIQMFVNKFKTEIEDENLFENLFKYVREYGKHTIDFSDFPFEIKDLPENVLKGLYIWNPERHKNYTTLKNDLETAPAKDLIVANIQNKNKETENAFGNINWEDF